MPGKRALGLLTRAEPVCAGDPAGIGFVAAMGCGAEAPAIGEATVGGACFDDCVTAFGPAMVGVLLGADHC